MKKIINLINKLKKNRDDLELLHDLRIACRSKLSVLNHKKEDDLGLKLLIKKSNKIRDYDVLMQKCKDKKILKYLKEKRKKEVEKFIKFLNSFKTQRVKFINKEYVVSKKKCLKKLEKDFLYLSDRELHKIRIFIKRCRYVFEKSKKNKKLVEVLKKLQTLLGESRDYYNCIKLMKKFNLNTTK
jgi:CHAD domain-containing protein